MAWGRQLCLSLPLQQPLLPSFRTADNVHVALSALLLSLILLFSGTVCLSLSLSLPFCLFRLVHSLCCMISAGSSISLFVLAIAYFSYLEHAYIFFTFYVIMMIVDCFSFFFISRCQTFEWHWLRCASMCLAKCVYSEVITSFHLHLFTREVFWRFFNKINQNFNSVTYIMSWNVIKCMVTLLLECTLFSGLINRYHLVYKLKVVGFIPKYFSSK